MAKSEKQPWMKFYPRDWEADEALRFCSLAAQGLWMRCICIMHNAKPYGHLAVGETPLDHDALARMVGAPVDEVAALMAELRKAGVYDVTRRGVVVSRRMIRDDERAKKGRKSVQKRWAQDVEMQEESGGPNRSPKEKLLLRSQIPEERKDTSDEVSPPPRPPPRDKPDKRGQRLDPGWIPSPEERRFAEAEGFDASGIDRIAAEFRDYWIAKPGAAGRMLNWTATWRNWIRREVKHDRRNRNAGRNPGNTGRAGQGGFSRTAVYAEVAREIEAERELRGDRDGADARRQPAIGRLV